jgi:predicted nucleic acid-binding protein
VKLVDSSGWLEFFIDGPLAGRYEAYLSDPSDIVTPTIVLYEVYKKIKRERSEELALVAAAQIQRTRMAPLTETLALTAADVSLQYRLAMADAVVYATAILHGAEMVTSDADFENLPNVTFLKINKRT